LRHLLVALLVVCSPWTWAEDVLVLGIFEYRPKELLLQRYQPLADHLSSQLPGVRIELQVQDQDGLESAMKSGQLDLVFTNPSHYVTLRRQFGFTGALATLISVESGHPTSQLGGVIVTRATDDRIRSLVDLRGRRILIPGTRYLGGFQTQAYELRQAGLDISKDVVIADVGSHDAVVRKLLDGEGDAGFVRTGLIEQLANEGQLDPTRLSVLNAQNPPGFPYRLSTALYPEWALVALPRVGSERIRKLSAALMTLDAQHPAAVAAGIAGFEPPHDYLPVESIMRSLHSPPFDQAEPITLENIWKQHRITVIVLLASAILVGVLVVMLLQRNRVVEAQRNQLRQMAFLDGLTGIANRRRFDEALQTEWRRCQRDLRSISLVMIDIDHFKRYNDHYGHQQGDECLRQVAQAIAGCLKRPSDLAARYGGEEFVCLLPNTDIAGAVTKAEQMRTAVVALGLPHESSPSAPIVTISLGVSTVAPDGQVPESLVEQADAQLYRAKGDGRNRVCTSAA